MTKQELRAAYLQKRKELTNAEVIIRSQRICELFFAGIDLSKVACLHTFYPIDNKREPDTRLIINRLTSGFPQIKIALPKINSASSEIENYLLLSPTNLKFNSWGIAEPHDAEKIETETIDLVLVPLLTFDQYGHRVGYGKGFYDRFLRRCRPDTKRIGISLFSGIDKITDVHSSDETLHQCITPEALITFR
jgi:5-formyltetrahydrofolate cyclo-ligase